MTDYISNVQAPEYLLSQDYDVTSKWQTFARHSAKVLYRLVWCMCTGNVLYTTAAEQLEYTV